MIESTAEEGERPVQSFHWPLDRSNETDKGICFALDIVSPAANLLLYSHDTFGLGHIRRNRKIAQALVDRFPGLSTTIITGSGLSNRYAPHPRIHFVELPQVEKLPNGTYSSAEPGMSYKQTIVARSELIRDCAENTDFQIFVADKEPLGLSGELKSALDHFRQTDTELILGLRDVLDDPDTVRAEWTNKVIFDAIGGLYDQIWIYGSEDFYNPLKGLGLTDSVLDSCSYTGFLYDSHPDLQQAPPQNLPPDYLLITAGGGGDGAFLMNSVLAAYESDPGIPFPAVLLLGPYTQADKADAIRDRASAVDGAIVIGFNAEPEVLIERSRAVIGMCGYNTFCEVIARRRPALFVPRQIPRTEQLIRAERAHELGYADVVLASEAADPARMAAATRQLTERTHEGFTGFEFDTNGLERICNFVGVALERRGTTALAVERAGS